MSGNYPPGCNQLTHDRAFDPGDDEIDDDEEPEFDCHMDPSTGQCGKAGSEECDFDCPFRSEADRICQRIADRRR